MKFRNQRHREMFTKAIHRLDRGNYTLMAVVYLFTADTREKVLCGSDNGIYRFFDNIFGDKDEKAETETEEQASEDITVTEPAQTASSADAA